MNKTHIQFLKSMKIIIFIYLLYYKFYPEFIFFFILKKKFYDNKFIFIKLIISKLRILILVLFIYLFKNI